MSAVPETTPRGRHSVSFVALYQNAKQPVRTLSAPINIIGRSRSCDLVLASESVAAAHTAILFSRGACFACDLGATRGTLINGRAVRCQQLADGDELTTGTFRVRTEGVCAESRREGTPRCSLSGSAGIGRVTSIDPLLVIGSGLGADLVIRDQAVAPVQCLVAWTDAGVFARDVGGGAGISVNGRRAIMETLRAGDSIVIGPHDVRFDIDSQPMPTRSDEWSELLDDGGGPSNRANRGLTLSRSDANWSESLDESEDMNLDVELSRDIRNLKDAHAEISAAKEAMERSRTYDPRPA